MTRWNSKAGGRIGIVVLGVALALTGAGSLIVRSRPAAPGRLVADPEEILFQGSPDNTPVARHAVGDFAIKNVGGRPVKILAAQSSCGCAEPRVSPSVIPPGGSGTVSVQALSLPIGEKVATITLQTDAEASPELVLRLRIRGGRRPPFLLRTGGDITYMGDYRSDEAREMIVATVEPSGEGRMPIVDNKIPFLKVEDPTVEVKPYILPGTVQKDYLYKVRLSGKPPAGPYHGEITVTDPWDGYRVERVRVSCESLPPIRVLPSRLLLSRGPGATLVVAAREPIPDLIMDHPGGKGDPFRLDVVKMSEDRRTATCRIAIREGVQAPDGDYEIGIRPGPSSADRAALFVRLVAEAR